MRWSRKAPWPERAGRRFGRRCRARPAPSRLVELAEEPDVFPRETVENDLEAASADHPLEAMVAIFALKESLLDELRDIRHPGDNRRRLFGGGRYARPLVHPFEPPMKTTLRLRRKTEPTRPVQIGHDHEVAPAKAVTAKPRPRPELPLEPAL